MRWLIVVVIALVVTSASYAAPHYLRDMDRFRVQSVEIAGTRFMAPEQALGASGITRQSSVFDNPELWRMSLLKHPIVRDVKIERHLPGTIHIQITETDPVALAQTPELRPVDARGNFLPIDLSAGALDLPVLSQMTGVSPRGTISNAGTMLLLQEVVRVRAMQPSLAMRVSEMRFTQGGFELLLRAPVGVVALLSPDADVRRMEQVELALADIASRNESAIVHRIDGRFHDQVVVSMVSQN